MESREKILSRWLDDARESVGYLKEINIGIPQSELQTLEQTLEEAYRYLQSDRKSMALNRWKVFNGLFQVAEQRHFSDLSPRMIDLISRSDQRPKTLDYARNVFEQFEEIKGFDANSPDPAVVCGFARMKRGGSPSTTGGEAARSRRATSRRCVQ